MTRKSWTKRSKIRGNDEIMTPVEISKFDHRNGSHVAVRLKDGLTFKGTWVGYLDKGGSTCGILLAMEEGGVKEIVEVLFSKIKSLA